ncbi:MAG: hypothetical protein IPM59_03445 [Chloracidobacterium sp.]|nr:hypothetical protein [Chloracidobacterium sp.]
MRVCTWNLNKANASRTGSWEYLSELQPDIALLQEVNAIPEPIEKEFDVLYRKALKKSGDRQNFGTAILVRGRVKGPLELSSEWDWVNRELALFNGNILGAEVVLDSGDEFNVISVYSPAWPIDPRRLVGSDISEVADNDIKCVKLENNPKIWGTELLWATLRFHLPSSDTPWLVGGDLNSSPTFDTMWPGGPHGNQEVLDRMHALNLTECLFHSKGELTPTFKNATDKLVIHQIDHLFASNAFIGKLRTCGVGDASRVFEGRLSDHLPIIADFGL